MNCRNISARITRTTRWCKAALLGAAFALAGTSNAQVDVSGANAATPNGSYATLAAAFAAINAQSQAGLAITIGISGNTTEPAAGAILGAGTWASVTIQPTGGAARTISGASTGGVPLIDLSGADNVNIDGLNTGGNSLTIENTTVSATTGHSTIRFIGGATNNTITNCSLKGAVSSSVATNGATVFFSTDAVTANGNDNNTISNCDIGPSGANLPTKAILGNGSTGTTAIGNSGIIITNNNIFDYFGAAVTSSGVAINGGCNTWTITNNRFYQTGTRTWTTGSIHRAIDLNSSSATHGVQGMTVTGNIVGYASNTQTGTYTLTGAGTGAKFQGIFHNGISTGATSNVNNNTVAAVSMTGVTGSGTTTSSPFTAILFQEGNGITNGNTIGSQSATGSLTFSTTTTSSTDVYGILNFSSNGCTASTNNIGGISVTNLGASGTFVLYGLRLWTVAAGTNTATSNTIGGTVANSIQLTSTGASSQVIGMNNNAGLAPWTGNTVRNLTNNNGTGTAGTASVIGLSLTTTGANHTLSQNTIHSLTNTNTTAATVVTGIQFTGSTANVVERNNIYGLTTATNSATAEVNGIRVAGGTTTYRNNMIAIGAGTSNAIGAVASNSAATGINGINEAGGTNNFWHNSVYIGGSATAGTGASYAFNESASLTATRSIRDNIFQNARSNSGATGKHYAVKINGTAANPTGLTINNNVYFANGTGAVFGFYNSLDVAQLAAPGWRTVVGQDAQSFESNPQYNDPTNATPDLHLHPTNPTVAEGNGVSVGVTDDFDGQTRASLTPVDIGADAGNYVGVDLTGPVITYTALGNTCSLGNRTLSATITDISGVPTAGAGLPVLYWRINAGAYTAATGTFISGNQYDFSFGAGAVVGDVVSYYIVAQDNAGTPNVSSNPAAGAGGFTSNPPAAGTPPTTPNSYTLQNLLAAGTYSIPGSYASLTAAVAAYNTSCLGGAIVFELAAGYTSGGETFPITINNNTDASAINTLTIRPASGQSPTITGSNATGIIVLNGADYVTIDGSNNSVTNTVCPAAASSRNMSIVNTNTGTASGVVWISTPTALNGAANNTVKNCILTGQGTGTTLVVAGAGGATVGSTALASIDNTRFENNQVTLGVFGIFVGGISTASKAQNCAINQNTLSSIGIGGIAANSVNLMTVSGNSVTGIANTGSTDAVAINLGFTPNNGFSATTTGIADAVSNITISNNVIGTITQTNTFSAIGIGLGVTSTGTSVIANNMISGVAANGTSGDFSAGIVLGGGAGSTTNVYYNTVSMQGTIAGTSAATQTAACLAVTNATMGTIDVKNNIFSNTQVGNTSATLRLASIALAASSFAGFTSDYNDLYSVAAAPGTHVVGITGGVVAGTSRPALVADWQPATGQDANSKSVLPVFVSPTDLHLDNTNASNIANLMTSGTVVSVTSDIDCQSRGATPSIGADNVTSTPCSGMPSAGTSSTTTPSRCSGQTATITNNAVNSTTGVVYQWQVGPVGGPYSDVVGGSGATTQSYTTGALSAGVYEYVLRVRCTNEIPPAGDSFSNGVTITVGQTPTASASSNSPVCTGNPINLDGTTDVGTSFAWTGPNAFASASEDPSIPSAALNNAGTYTFTATLGSCSSTPANTVVVVNATPTGVTANATDLFVCDGETVDLTSSAAAPPTNILSENFNGGPGGWTTVNNTTGGATPAAAAWTLRPSPFSPGGSWSGSISSNDATQYYFTNGDAAGSGSTTATQLISPVMDLSGYTAASLSFWHFYQDIGGDDTARVEVTTNGGVNWTIVQTYNTNQGTQSGFVNAVISLNSFAGSSAVQFRYRYRGTWDWGWAVDNVSVTGTPVAYTYAWTSTPSGFTSNVQNPTGVTVSPVPTTYTVTVSSPFCSAQASVTVNPDPTDTDGDTFPDCTDECPAVFGEIGDPCNDGNPNTFNDVVTGPSPTCGCAGTACTLNLTLEFQLDGVSTENWEIRAQGTNTLIQSGSAFLPVVGNFMVNTCVPNGCFYLKVTDDGGDGITGGGYILRTTSPSKRIIDNRNNFTSGAVSQIAGNQGWCVTAGAIGADRLITASCDRLDLQRGATAACSEKLTADNIYGTGSIYQFWVYNPNGPESQLIPATGAGSNILSMNQITLPAGKLYNIKVRTRISPGVYRDWGTACRMSISTTTTPCRTTKLVDDVSSPNWSCGKTVTLPAVGGGNGAQNMLVAKPATRLNANCVEVGANKYQFRIKDIDTQISTVISGVGSNYYCYMTQPTFAPCRQYEVDVRVSFDNGATWCNYSDVCTVYTGGCLWSGGEHMGAGGADMHLYPNPNRGDQITLRLEGIGEVGTVSVDIYDAFGKRVIARTIAAQDGFVNQPLELNGTLAAGLYVVNITARETTYTERLVIEP